MMVYNIIWIISRNKTAITKYFPQIGNLDNRSKTAQNFETSAEKKVTYLRRIFER